MKFTIPKPRWWVTSAVLFGGLILGLSSPLMSEPVHPIWWNDRGVISDRAVENRAVANVGQLKHMATQAHAELEMLLPGGAGFVLPFLQPPANADAEWSVDQKKALNLGQIKAVALSFYDRLNAISPIWVEQQLQLSGLTTLNMDYFRDSDGHFYPWNPDTPVEVNYKVATVGQIKLVFALRFNQSIDGDRLPDLWEYLIINASNADEVATLADVDPDDDFDGDGLTNRLEYLAQTDPLVVTDSSEFEINNREDFIRIYNTHGLEVATAILEFSEDGPIWEELAEAIVENLPLGVPPLNENYFTTVQTDELNPDCWAARFDFSGTAWRSENTTTAGPSEQRIHLIGPRAFVTSNHFPGMGTKIFTDAFGQRHSYQVVAARNLDNDGRVGILDRPVSPTLRIYEIEEHPRVGQWCVGTRARISSAVRAGSADRVPQRIQWHRISSTGPTSRRVSFSPLSSVLNMPSWILDYHDFANRGDSSDAIFTSDENGTLKLLSTYHTASGGFWYGQPDNLAAIDSFLASHGTARGAREPISPTE